MSQVYDGSGLKKAAGAGGGNTGSISAGTTNATLGEVVFSNSNGVSFGVNGQTVTATVQTNYLTTAMLSNRGTDFVQATAAFAGTSASGTINSTGISVSVGPYITTGMLSNAVTLSNIRVSAGTTSNLLSALTFADGGGVSFGINASTITATVQTNYLTSQSNQAASAANGSFTFQTLSFSNLNGISFGTSAGSAITASHNALTSQSNQAFSADVSSAFQTLVFQDSNGVSFSNNAGSLRVTHGLQHTSATSAITSAAVHTSAARISGIQVGNTTHTNGTITFQDANGVSFGSSGASGISVSHALQFTSATSAITSNALHTSASRVINIVAATNTTGGGTASLSSNVSFSAANGITFYTSAGNAIVGSHNAITTGMASNRGSDFVQATAAFFGTNASGTIASGAISVSVAAPGGGGNITVSDTATSLSVSRLAFTNSNGVTMTLSTAAGAATVIVSHNALTSQSNQNVTAGNGGFAFQTLSFSNLNGISFGTSAGSAITASHNAITTGRASTDAIGLNTAQTNVTWTVNSSGLSLDAGGYAGTTTGFAGANISGSMTHNTAGLNLSLSVAAPGAAAITQSIGLSTQTQGGSIAGTTGYATGDDVLYHFVPGSNITMSQSLNGASATLSIFGPAAGGGVTLSTLWPYGVPYGQSTAMQTNTTNTTRSGESVSLYAMPIEDYYSIGVVGLPYSVSLQNSNVTTTASVTAGIRIGFYTRTGSTLSLFTSASLSFAEHRSSNTGRSWSCYDSTNFTGLTTTQLAGSANSTVIQGSRMIYMPVNTLFTPGMYWLGLLQTRSTAGGALSMDFNAMGVVIQSGWTAFAPFGKASAGFTSNFQPMGQYAHFCGTYAATVNSLPNSINHIDVRHGGASLVPAIMMWST